MAMQTGLGVSKVIILAGAGYTGTVLLQSGKLSDLLAELQNVLKQQAETEGDSDALAAQVRRLAMEVRQLASARPITVLNGGSGTNGLASLLVPAATVGALGYGYMWWKGISFSDLMYVTKKNMATAVANLTKHLEHVSDALAATKKHLTQRIENLDGKLDDQIGISKQIKQDVTEVRGDLSQITYDLDELQRMVSGLDGRLVSMEAKQDATVKGVMYLCSKAQEMQMPGSFQEQFKLVGNSFPSLTGLKDLGSLEAGSNDKSITDGISGGGINKLDRKPRGLTRIVSAKC
ncbi:hypothetical protein M9H77_25133 [Catharanthus roseus]|uniref:Uncharacterized protein n=1 Tax=Catharanthus roseus TaxID=4058 RepID=A0ACC0A7H2_CATRO|nr:hypothetical protein M9H77_25133 [Catharanthus roseus]